MIIVKIPSHLINEIDGYPGGGYSVDDNIVDIARSLPSFEGFFPDWGGREMTMQFSAKFTDESDAAFFKLSL